MTIEGQTGQITSISADLLSVKTKLKSTEDTCTSKEEKIRQLLREVDDARNKNSELEAQIREDENTRKKLHNTIQVHTPSAQMSR